MLYLSPAIIIPADLSIIQRAILALDEEGPCCLAEIHSGDKRGWRVEAYTYPNRLVKRFSFNNQQDAFDMWIEVNTPRFDPRVYNIDPDTDIYWNFAITQSLTTGPGANQSFNVPATWGPSNTIECIGGSGAGAFAVSTTGSSAIGGAGGGGGAYAIKSGAAYDRNGTATYQIGNLAAASLVSGTRTTGGDTWFGGTTLAASDCGAKGGSSGVTDTTAFNSLAGIGGLASASIGDTKRNGGNGGAGIAFGSAGNIGGAGGGGAAGSTAAGSVGTAADATGTGHAGGNSDTATGGGNIASGQNVGADGTDFDASHGAGAGGSGGGSTDGVNRVGGAGGLYGGGSGGAGCDGNHVGNLASVNGKQGMIFLTWNPFDYTESYCN